MRRNLRRGLTLIEVLTVIAIVALLAGIALPVLAEVRTESLRGVATSVLRQSHLALTLYRESDGAYPPDNLDPLVTTGVLRSETLLLLAGDPYPNGFASQLANCEGKNRPGNTKLKSSIEWVFATDESGKQLFLDTIIRPLDSNPGLLAVRIYGSRAIGSDCNRGEFFGRFLRVREDGSVQRFVYDESTGPGQRRTCYPALFSDVGSDLLCGKH